MGVPVLRQVAELQQSVRSRLAPFVPDAAWIPPQTGPESGFRNKAKLVIGGTRHEPTFGILDGDYRGIDLRDCGLYEPGLHASVMALTQVVAAWGLTPYDVGRRSGEFKHLIVTQSPDGEAMVRFVLRSPGQRGKIVAGLPELLAQVPGLRVVSINLQPEHKAILEGPTEEIITPAQTLPMRMGTVTLQLRPGSFFQTNTVVAQKLYAQAASWAGALEPTSMWDLYCGVGGFGLQVAAQCPALEELIGIESSPEAVRSAQLCAQQLGAAAPARTEFVVGDARAALQSVQDVPDLVLVNPPRRGIGSLADELDAAPVRAVLYSSCNADSLAQDLARMPHWRVERAGLFAMFPQTRHHEVLVALTRV
ncbi:methyltransferase domain-containing protein [Dermacoccaceae bacterium W4C1]